MLALTGLLVGAVQATGQEAPPSLKIFVEADGLYRLTHADLTGAGFQLESINPRHLRLTTGGVEASMIVMGEDDETFDTDDYILFYGQAATGPYTRRNVYWLSAGAAPGARMAEVDGTPSAAHPTPDAFPDTLHVELDRVYWQNPPDGSAADHWFWTEEMRAPASTTVTFSLDQVVPDGQATLRVRLRGRTDDVVAPDHHTRLRLNGVTVGDTGVVDEAWWDGDVPFTHTAAFSPTLLVSGVNTLTVETVGDTGAVVDGLYLNWLELDYRRGYIATGALLRFTAPASGTYAFEVAGFSGDDVWLFDVTASLTPTRVVSATAFAPRMPGQTEFGTVSGGTLRFSAWATPATRYLALTPAAWQSPAGLALDTTSDLHSSANGADEIIIAPADFANDSAGRSLWHVLEPLVAHRQADGLRVVLVDVQDVYDEFAYGLFDPTAIRDFLRYTYQHWQLPAPAYVLLVGDANMDYLDRFRSGAPNQVPTLVIDTWPMGETPSDNGYVRLAGDDVLPEMALGRIPARTADEVAGVVSKIIAYESTPPQGDWNARALFVADDDSASFESVSEGLIGALPPAYRPLRLYARGYAGDPSTPIPLPAARSASGQALTADIAEAINSGVLLVNYVGHGSVDNWGTWAGGRIWAESDVGGLHNQALPFVTVATCINGFFAHPLDARSLAEAWVLAEGGAVAAWAPTALGDPAGHRVLFGALYEALFSDGVTRIGEATRRAKWAAYEQSPVLGALVETYVLFGDPAMKLRLLERPYPVYLPLVTIGWDAD